jgi:peptidoglycan/LPS O-acetylase OafA/YrhL
VVLAETKPPVPGPSRLPHLDGLRGIAILLVLPVHSPLRKVFDYGWIGVDLFFVLSGYLITGILLDSKGRPGYFSSFYARRALRIWPLYYFVLTIAFGVSPYLGGIFAVHVGDGSLPWFLTYLQNWGAGSRGPAGLVITWSLAIEEQFYAVWPLVVFLLSRRTLAVLAGAVFALSPVIRYGLLTLNVPDFPVYTTTFARLDGLAAGALLAIVVRSARVRMQSLVRWSGWLAGLGGAASILALRIGFVSPYVPADKASYVLGFSAIAVAFAGWSGLAIGAPRIQRLLTWSLLTHCGRISYGLYIYHYMLFLWAHQYLAPWLEETFSLDRQLSRLIGWVIGIVLTFAVAEASFRWVESPILALKDRFVPGVSRRAAVDGDSTGRGDKAVQSAGELAVRNPVRPFPGSSGFGGLTWAFWTSLATLFWWRPRKTRFREGSH